ncbi:MAG TPA: hypothetical protein EYH38_04005 [Leucothrix sp.]|nr:hypothetical protein [Leucothrix sp.]
MNRIKKIILYSTGLLIISANMAWSSDKNNLPWMLLLLNSGGNPQQIRKQLIDAPLAGVDYYCDEKEVQKTTMTGEFTCQNLPVVFKIGKLILGSISRFTFDGNIFPQDLVGVSRDNFTDEELIELIRLLQSLDADGVIDNVIEIPDDMASKFDDEEINSKTLEEKADIAGVSLVSKEDAVAHLTNSMINVKRDIGQFGLDRMKLWMTACWYKHGDTRDSYGITVVKVAFQEGKVKIGEMGYGYYLLPYAFFENEIFKMYTPDGVLLIDAKGLGEEYYQDSISDTKDIISLWATEAEAKAYQDQVGDGNPQHRTCTIGAIGLRPLPQ